MSRKVLMQAIAMVVVVACAFFYFLIFAQFAFLHRMESVGMGDSSLELSMACMGLGGLIACFLVARCFRPEARLMWIAGGFVGCGIVSAVTGAISIGALYPFFGFSIGVAVGVLTVSIAASLRAGFPEGRIGVWTGLGVGLAYLGSNIPYVFRGDPIDHCLLATIGCAIGAVACAMLQRREEGVESVGRVGEEARFFNHKGLWLAAALFLILVWFDSAAFYVIQETALLKGSSWGGDAMLLQNAVVHFAVALVAGLLLDRGWLLGLLVASLFGLSLGVWGLQFGDATWSGISTAVYVAAVSIYSTALTAMVGLSDWRVGMWSSQARAGVVYAVAGWFGSAMGIGMAKDLHRVPLGFVVVAYAVFLAACAWIVHLRNGRVREEFRE